MPDTLSLFPLSGALLLPRARLPLHVFEPRYLQMFDDALKSDDRLIGMIQPDGDGLQKVGCAGRVTQFSETEDGRYMVTLSGVSRFELLEEIDGFHPYRRASVSWDVFHADQVNADVDAELDRPHFMDTLSRYMNANELETDWDCLKQADDELLINSLSMLLNFDAKDKQALLEAKDLTQRREVLSTLMEFALMRGGESDRMQ